jgi:hypothetical protein
MTPWAEMDDQLASDRRNLPERAMPPVRAACGKRRARRCRQCRGSLAGNLPALDASDTLGRSVR